MYQLPAAVVLHADVAQHVLGVLGVKSKPLVTGDWDAAGKRDSSRPGEEEDAGDSDDGGFGDFEDIETGESELFKS